MQSVSDVHPCATGFILLVLPHARLWASTTTNDDANVEPSRLAATFSKGTNGNLERLVIPAHSLRSPRVEFGAMKDRNSGKNGSITASRRELLENIAHHLKAYYDIATPLPDHLAELAEKLAQRIDAPPDEAEET